MTWTWVLGLCLAAPRGVLLHEDFEGPFGAAGVPDAWRDNSSWANLEVTYARDTDQPHGGAASQRIDCTRLDNGAVQLIPARPVPLVRGRVYRVRCWLRAEPAQPVAVQLRLAPSPYTIYVEQALAADHEWRQVDYYWTATVDDANGLFMLRFTAPGTVWFDDLTVEEVDPATVAATQPAPEGDLLLNGDFALDRAGWLLNHGADYWTEAEWSVEPLPEGGHCLRWSLPEGVGLVLRSTALPAVPGHPLHVTCRAKADRPAELTFGCRERQTRSTLTDAWTTLSVEAAARFAPSVDTNVVFVAGGPATVWIRDVHLWQAGEPERKPAAAILPDRFPMGLYNQPDRPTLVLRAAGNTGEVRYRVVDYWGEEVASGSWHPERSGTGYLSPRPGTVAQRASQEISILSQISVPCGWYRAEATWGDGPPGRVHESTFVVLPPSERTGPVERSPFGAHFSVDPTGLALAKAVGCRWLRLHPPNHTKWRVVEPAKGDWRWHDEAIQRAVDAGLTLWGSLDRLPTWASSAPPGTPDFSFYTGTGAWLPRDWSEWESYVAQTVARYRDRIHVWEIWNEPNLGGWLIPREGQSHAAAYFELLQHTTPVVRRVDPTATVVAGVVAGALTEGSPATKFGDELIDLGGLDLMDAFSFHDYITRPVDEGADPLATWLARLRAKMRAAGRELPIFNSEGGFANPGTSLRYRAWAANTVPADQMAKLLVRQYVAQWANGVDRFFFYNFFIDGSPVTADWEGFLEGEGQPRPSVAAYATLSWLLDGATFDRSESPSADAWVHHFNTPRGPLAVAWARTGGQVPWQVNNATEAWNVMGGPLPVPQDGRFRLTDEPVFVRLR